MHIELNRHIFSTTDEVYNAQLDVQGSGGQLYVDFSTERLR